MSDPSSSDDFAPLRALVPLNTLPDEALGQLVEAARFEALDSGAVLFDQGDTDHQHVYLLDGRVSLINGGAVAETIEHGSEMARFPLAHQLPRKQGARAASAVRVVRFDSRLLSDLLARSQTVAYQVDDFDEASEDDWMGMLLQSRVLQQVPAANIQRVMMSVEHVEVSKGDTLITQGDAGDYYYMLTSGRAVVRRDNGDGKGPVELATLGPGDAFGEEALLSDSPRNSSITMLQDGHVLRLGKEQFLDLIQDPLVERLDMASAPRVTPSVRLWMELMAVCITASLCWTSILASAAESEATALLRATSCTVAAISVIAVTIWSISSCSWVMLSKLPVATERSRSVIPWI